MSTESDDESFDTIDVLQKLGHKELVEVLSEGLKCEQCQTLLQNRILNLNKRKSGEVSMSTNTSTERSSANESSTSVSKRQRSGSSTSSDHSPNSVHYSSKRRNHAANLSLSPSEDENECIKFSQVSRKKDFVHIEKVNGNPTNILEGLELHTRVFSVEEQNSIINCVYNLQEIGQKGRLKARTYSEPKKWMRGKGRITMQFGCCYNYAVDKNGNPPGIMRDEDVDPIPPVMKEMIKKMVRWHVLPPTCVPDSCIVNIYEEGDCIPPHIDHHDFLRPFCTVSLLTECNIIFGQNLKIVGAGEFSGPVSLPLPVGSVLILKGNGADVAKHSIPAVPTKRISITFRKMDDSKLPYKFLPDPELLGIKPLRNIMSAPIQRHRSNDHDDESGDVK